MIRTPPKQRINKENCKAVICAFEVGKGYILRQCRKKAGKTGYCWQHLPYDLKAIQQKTIREEPIGET